MQDQLQPYIVVIVDDDDAFRIIIRKRLEFILKNAVFYEFATLAAARESYNEIKSQIDLVLLDQHLPDGHGLELLNEGLFEDSSVLAVSSDHDPSIPGNAVVAGAAYFLSKKSVSESLFAPLVKGLIDRARINRQLTALKIEVASLKTVKTLVSTLRHEINNPLGGVLGGAFLLKNREGVTADEKKAAEIVEKSGQRIKHVLDELCNTISLDSVTKGGQDVFHIPGDKKWE